MSDRVQLEVGGAVAQEMRVRGLRCYGGMDRDAVTAIDIELDDDARRIALVGPDAPAEGRVLVIKETGVVDPPRTLCAGRRAAPRTEQRAGAVEGPSPEIGEV